MQQGATYSEGQGERLSALISRRVAGREWRKRRPILIAGGVLLAASLLMNVLLALSLLDTRRSVDDLRRAGTATAAEPDISGLREQLRAHSARLDELADQSGGGTGVAAGDFNELRRELRAVDSHLSCTDRAVRTLDDSLRKLLTRDLNPNQYIERPPLPNC